MTSPRNLGLYSTSSIDEERTKEGREGGGGRASFISPSSPTRTSTSAATMDGRRVSISEFDDGDFLGDNVNSPGASSTSSEPIYVRQPGFDHHAHEFRIPAAADTPITAVGDSGKSTTYSTSTTHSVHHPQRLLEPSTSEDLKSNFFPITPPEEGTLSPSSSNKSSRVGNHTPPGYNKGPKKKKSSVDSKNKTKKGNHKELHHLMMTNEPIDLLECREVSKCSVHSP